MMLNKPFDTPILIIIFSRLEFSRQILDKIREIRASKLYIACDRWRDGVEGEEVKVKASREYFEYNIDWDCDVKYLYAEKNQGSGRGVFNAISWVFSNERKSIILEEDVIPSISFFYFCEQLLNKYEKDLRIWKISGQNHFLGKFNLVKEDSYFFSKYASIWGWATWADRWDKVSFEMDGFDRFIECGFKYSHMSKEESEYQLNKEKRFFQNLQTGTVKTWDTPMGFTLASNMGIGIVPAENLTTNVGVEGVHSKGAIKYAHLLPAKEGFQIKKHPDFMQINYMYDKMYFKLFRQRKNLISRVFNKMKKTLETNFNSK